jgi:hypothetical protein
MAITATPGGGYDVTGAHGIVANLLVFALKQAAPSAIRAAITAVAGTMVGQLTRDLPGGSKETYPISVSGNTGGNVQIPPGTFSYRDVTYSVDAAGLLTLTITSLDTYGLNEIWHLETTITSPADGVTTFKLRLGGNLKISSVTVTPIPVAG